LRKAVNLKTKILFIVELHPTDKTIKILDQWKEAHTSSNSEIPYPKEPIQSQNWDEVAQCLNEIKLK